ncbi:MAG: pyridoxamine 5'-phosphate oxidase family protein [Nocardioides sp.]|uniref:pyridoxamine 5'-phosphate oxidase family protein n=1 Tax=Nocardioides sp. TaxID=35761 RepID=UPI0032632FE4
MTDLLELSRSECEGLLRLGVVGRVAIATPTGPHILPLNYAISRGDVVVCTSPYSVLGTYGRDSLLAFEIDHFDHPRHHGWSVVVRGRAAAVEDPEELSTLVKVVPRPWAGGSRSLFLRIPLTEVTGRRLGAGWDLEQDLPVHRVM